MKISSFFCSFFSKYFQKSSDFVNSDDCSGKTTSKSIRLQPDFVQKRFEVDKNRFILVENWDIQIIVFKNMLGEEMYQIFGEDLYLMRFTGNILSPL